MSKDLMKKIIDSDLCQLFILTLLSLPVLIPLIGPGLVLTHDQFFPLHRLMAMENCLQEGQFPPRWNDYFGMGYGYPFFNFYAPLAYLLGLIFLYIFNNPVWAIHAVFGLSLVMGGVGAWLWLRKIFGNWAGMVAGILYNYYPYHLVNAYVRGDISELLASALFPWVLWGFSMIEREGVKRCFGILTGAFFFCLVLLSHNIMALLFTGLLTAWIIYKSYQDRKYILPSLFAFSGGLGLSAFFWLPAFYEKKYVNIAGLLQDAPYHDHFVYWFQFIKLNWGYGGSCAGPGDGMSFQLGLVFLAATLLAGIVLITRWHSFRKPLRAEALFWLAGWGIMVFIMTASSLWFWDHLPLIKYVLYPWRFLSLTALPMAFMTAFLLGGGFFSLKKNKQIALAGIGFILLALILIIPCLKLRQVRVPEEIYLQRTVWSIESATHTYGTTMSNEYLPIWVKKMPESPINNLLVSKEGQPFLMDVLKNDSCWKKIELELSQDGTIIIPIFYFPGWKVFIDGQMMPFQINQNGFMELKGERGKHLLEIRFVNSPDRLLANIISLISWILWVGGAVLLAYYACRKKKACSQVS
jgi:hypothetical protein